MAGTGLPGGSVAGLQGGAEEAKPGEVRTPWGGGGPRLSLRRVRSRNRLREALLPRLRNSGSEE